MSILQVQSLVKSYQNTQILNQVNLNLNKGDFAALLGKSGSGKSTLLHILGALDTPDSGEIALDGKKYSTMSSNEMAEIRNTQIGFVFQFHHLLPEFTLLENILIPSMIKYQNSNLSKDYAMYLLDNLGIMDKANNKPNQLSGGEQQRGALARALINKPTLLLADEPTGNLDNENATILYQLLSKLNKELNQTIVMATHNEQMVLNCNKIIRLENKQLTFSEK